MNDKTTNMALYVFVAIAVTAVSQYSGYWVNNNIELQSTLELNSLITVEYLDSLREWAGCLVW